MLARRRSLLPHLLFAASLLALGGLAAAWSAASQPADAQPGTPTARAQAYLSRNAGGLGLQANLSDLRLANRRESLTGDHIRYQQTVNGVPVFGAYVSVSLPKASGHSPLVINRYASHANAGAFAAQVAPADVLASAVASLGGTDASELKPAVLVYYRTGKQLVPAWEYTLRTQDPFGEWQVIADAGSGKVLLRQSLLRYDSGRVFDPNPAVTNGGTAPVADCDGPARAGALSAQYRTRTLEGLDHSQGKLVGDFVDLTAPGITGGYLPAGQADEADHNYIYGCNDPRFEEVMAYYHLDATQWKIQSLGFTGESAILDRRIAVHAHYMADCNAFYAPTDRALHFGDSAGLGCGAFAADSAEDADVIIHEYGHAIQDDQVPGWGEAEPPSNEQARAIGEGFGDFLAADMNGDPCIGEYVNFGFSECAGSPGLRYLQNSMDYPAGFESCPDMDYNYDGTPESEEEHCGGLLWGGALWDLVEALSGGPGNPVTQDARDTTLRLVLESHFFVDQIATFDQAAAAICLADELLYGSAHEATIGAVFLNRGIDSGACTSNDFASVYVLIRHTFAGDLDVNVLAGANKDAPLCEVDLLNPFLGNPFPDIYGYEVLDADACGGSLPPTADQPWWLEVQDAFPEDVGFIEDFQILLPGGIRCIATDTPVDIPDAPTGGQDRGPAVYSKIDCTNMTGPGAGTPSPGTSTPTPTPTGTPGPGGIAGDVDCNGNVNSVDALKTLRYVASMTVQQIEPCADIGVDITGFAAQGGQRFQGDVDCNGSVDAVDALKSLRYVAGLPNNLPNGCPPIGSG